MFFHPRILDAFAGYNRKLFTKDILAGLTVGIVALPLAMAFAIASGLKPEAGIFTAIIAGFFKISLNDGFRIGISFLGRQAHFCGSPLADEPVAPCRDPERHVLIPRKLVLKRIFAIIKGGHVTPFLMPNSSALIIGTAGPTFNAETRASA